jgi:ERCC4-type nuclease
MIVIANDNGSRELAPYFTRRGIEVVVDEMEFSDFAFEGHTVQGTTGSIGVERKTIPDLINCMHDGRFADHQLKGMLSTFEECYLLVEGVYNEASDGTVTYWSNGRERYTKVTYKQLDKFLLTVTRQAGFRILKSCGKDQTATIVGNLYEHCQKPIDDHQSLNRFRTDASIMETLTTKHSLVRRCSKEFPGIGWTKSLVFDRAFPSLFHLVNSSVGDMAELKWQGKRIGEKLATRIYKAIRGE